MREIYYINSRGDRINLDRWPYRLKNRNPQNWEWEYDVVNMGSVGGKVQRIFRNVSEFDLTITVCTQAGGDAQRLMDVKNLYEGLEYDSATGNVGKLFFGPEYMQCCFIRSEKTTNGDIPFALDVEMTILSPYPMWCREETFNYYRYNAAQSRAEASGLNYPYNYPYNYSRNLALNYLVNNNYREDDFEMKIFGPINDPIITIGDNVYSLETQILQNEYVVINSRDKEVYKVNSLGQIINIFNSRSKNQSFFKKIPYGKNQVIYSGNFAFEITLFHERSEPDWTLY